MKKDISKESDKFIPSNILEGILSIRSLISARESGINNRRINTVYFDRAKQKSKSRELYYLNSKAEAQGFTVELADASELDAITVGSTHGGIVAFCGERDIPALSPEAIAGNGFYVMLEGVEDPYNFGYALRSLYASGVTAVIMPPRNWMSAAGVVCRASAGASELFRLYISDSAEAATMFKNKTYKIICADKSDRSVSAFDADLKFPLFLVIGGEKRGISQPVLQQADLIVQLDYARRFPAALSAASAASILSYEIFRQNRH